MSKLAQRWKISLTLGVLIAAGIVMMTVGMREVLYDNQRAAEKQQFEKLVFRFRETFEAGSKEDPLSIADEFGELARRSEERPAVASRAFYNQGWIHLRAFVVGGEKEQYLMARAALRDALRKDPQFFDAKYNLVYLELLANFRGIADLAVPFQPKNNLAQDDKGLGTPSDAKNEPNSQEGDPEAFLKNKIKRGENDQVLGGEPLDPDNFDPEESVPPPPPKEY